MNANMTEGTKFTSKYTKKWLYKNSLIIGTLTACMRHIDYQKCGFFFIIELAGVAVQLSHRYMYLKNYSALMYKLNYACLYREGLKY